MGDGMLSMRAKPPAEVEFYDIFQKFKLSFNLLVSNVANIVVRYNAEPTLNDYVSP